VQRVKGDAAALGVVDRIGEKVIEVDEHCGEDDESGSAPALAKEKPRHRPGGDGVKTEMRNR
jgi:hypothetical protein